LLCSPLTLKNIVYIYIKNNFTVYHQQQLWRKITNWWTKMTKTSLWSSTVNWSNFSRTRYCRSLLTCLGNSLSALWCYWTGVRFCRPLLRRLYPITLMEAAVCIENNTSRWIGILHTISNNYYCFTVYKSFSVI